MSIAQGYRVSEVRKAKGERQIRVASLVEFRPSRVASHAPLGDTRT
jgi:hypothetical protein